MSSIKGKTKSFLKRATFNFFKKNPKAASIVHKLSKKIAEEDKNPLVRFQKNELFKSYTMSHGIMKPSVDINYKQIKKYILTDVDISSELQTVLSAKIIRSIDEISETEISGSLFYIYYTCDSDALPQLKKIVHAGGRFLPHINFKDDLRTSYRFVNRLAYNALRKTWLKAERVALLDAVVHENLCEALELTKNIEGDYVEIGVYLGGSALTALNYLNELNKSGNVPYKKAWLLDTFDGFNYKEAKESADIIWAGTHQLYGVEATKNYISDTLKDTGILFELIAGNICSDDLPSSINKIAVANIDVDLYEPTLAALNKVAPNISKGGIIISEDATATPGTYGAYLALTEFLETQIGKEFIPLFKKGQYFLIRQ
jgi:hypothetical protein